MRGREVLRTNQPMFERRCLLAPSSASLAASLSSLCIPILLCDGAIPNHTERLECGSYTAGLELITRLLDRVEIIPILAVLAPFTILGVVSVILVVVVVVPAILPSLLILSSAILITYILISLLFTASLLKDIVVGEVSPRAIDLDLINLLSRSTDRLVECKERTSKFCVHQYTACDILPCSKEIGCHILYAIVYEVGMQQVVTACKCYCLLKCSNQVFDI